MLDFTAYDRILNAPWLIERFRDRYVDRTRLKQVGLMWNAYLPQYQPRCIPTEEIDAYLFDRTMDWVIAVTHEDAILCLGI